MRISMWKRTLMIRVSFDRRGSGWMDSLLGKIVEWWAFVSGRLL